jgi:hypothetical protein
MGRIVLATTERGDIVEEFIAFVVNVLCAAALWESGETQASESHQESTRRVPGVITENKAPSVLGCPVERFPVRFGRDGDAHLVDLSAFTPTTLEAMRTWPAPSVLPPANRIAPFETTVLAFDATLIEYRRERDFDASDYRLVLADATGRTIIAKISSPECAEADSDEPGPDPADSRFLAGINVSRAEFTARLSPTTKVERVSIHVHVMGLGMFDSPSGQAGEAPNGIQLCPVLDISFDEARGPVVNVPGQHHPREKSGRR